MGRTRPRSAVADKSEILLPRGGLKKSNCTLVLKQVQSSYTSRKEISTNKAEQRRNGAEVSTSRVRGRKAKRVKVLDSVRCCRVSNDWSAGSRYMHALRRRRHFGVVNLELESAAIWNCGFGCVIKCECTWDVLDVV